MNSLAIGFNNDTQIPAKRIDICPKSNATIVLHFGAFGMLQYVFNPFIPQIGTTLEYAISMIIGSIVVFSQVTEFDK